MNKIMIVRNRLSDGSHVYNLVLNQPFCTEYIIECPTLDAAEHIAKVMSEQLDCPVTRSWELGEAA